MYSIPDEINSFGDCSLHGYVIQCLNKHYNHNIFKHIPNTLTDIIATYFAELFGDVNDFELKYRKVRNQFKSAIYTFTINHGVECFYDAYDNGDDYCLYSFLLPRTKRDTLYIDEDEPIYNNYYDEIIEHIKYSNVRCCNFKNFFINYTKTIEELILIFYNSIQDYHDYKLLMNHTYPNTYSFCSVNTASCLYYSTEYDSDYDDDDSFEEFAETIHIERNVLF